MKTAKLIIAVACAVLPLSAMAQTKYARGLLLELYTGQECANCPPQSNALKEIVADEGDTDRLVWISHHYGYTSDTLTIEASERPAQLCGISGAPHLIFNRTLTKLGTGLPCLSQRGTTLRDYNDYLLSSQGKSFIRQEMEAGADVSIDMDVTYDAASRALKVNVFGEKNDVFEASNPTITVYLVQKTWVGYQNTGYQQGSPLTFDLNYHHKNPVRMLLSADPLGDAVDFDADGAYEMQFETTVPHEVSNYSYDGHVGNVMTELDTDSLFVVAFIANVDETPVDNINYYRDNIKVYNAVKCPMGNYSTVGIAAHRAEYAPVVVAESGRILVDGSDAGFEIYSLAGTRLPNCGLGAGIYVVRMLRDGVPVVSKVVVD